MSRPSKLHVDGVLRSVAAVAHQAPLSSPCGLFPRCTRVPALTRSCAGCKHKRKPGRRRPRPAVTRARWCPRRRPAMRAPWTATRAVTSVRQRGRRLLLVAVVVAVVAAPPPPVAQPRARAHATPPTRLWRRCSAPLAQRRAVSCRQRHRLRRQCRQRHSLRRRLWRPRQGVGYAVVDRGNVP